MATANSGGLMVKNMKDSSLRTNATDKANLDGKMAENTKANGKEESNMEQAFIGMAKVKREEASGQMVSVCSGSADHAFRKKILNIYSIKNVNFYPSKLPNI